jgi:hypothetical protein
MRVRAAAPGILLALVAGRALCQSDSPWILSPDVVAAENFFLKVQARLGMVGVSKAEWSQPTIEESIGLTEQQAKELAAIVVDYAAKNRSYLFSLAPLRREALFQSIESGQVSEELVRRVQNLQNEHAQMVSSQRQRLQTALGVPLFRALEALLEKK